MEEERKRILCDACSVAVAEVVGPTLVIHQKHHGEKHTTVIEVASLLKLMNEHIAEATQVVSGKCVR